jgi:hypothetical protein
MDMKKTLTAVIALALMMTAASARADVTYQPYIGFGADFARNQLGEIIANGTFVMVLDRDGDGWGGVPYVGQNPDGNLFDNASSWVWDIDDLLMDRSPIVDGATDPGPSFIHVGDPTAGPTAIPG